MGEGSDGLLSFMYGYKAGSRDVTRRLSSKVCQLRQQVAKWKRVAERRKREIDRLNAAIRRKNAKIIQLATVTDSANVLAASDIVGRSIGAAQIIGGSIGDEGALRHASVAAQVAIAEAILAVLEAATPWLQATKNGGDQ